MRLWFTCVCGSNGTSNEATFENHFLQVRWRSCQNKILARHWSNSKTSSKTNSKTKREEVLVLLHPLPLLLSCVDNSLQIKQFAFSQINYSLTNEYKCEHLSHD